MTRARGESREAPEHADGHRRPPRAAAPGLAACGALGLLAATLSGCTGADAAQQPTASAAAEAVRDAAARLVRTGGAQARTAMELSSGGTRVTIRGQGRYDFAARRGRLTVLLPADAKGEEEHRPVGELLAPGALYMKNRGEGVPAGKWVRVATSTLADGNLVTGGVTDPLLAAGLLRGAGKVSYVGTEDLAGTEVRHYRGVAELGRAAKALEGADRAALGAAAKGFARTGVPFDAYLDEQGLLRKVRHRFSLREQSGGRGQGAEDGGEGHGAGGQGAGGSAARTVTVASTTLLFDFGRDARAIRLPAAHEVYKGRIAER